MTQTGYSLSKDAANTLEQIYEYSLITFGDTVADEYYISLHDAFEMLAQQPGLGRDFNRFKRYEHREHSIFYKPTLNGIIVLHVLHHKQNQVPT